MYCHKNQCTYSVPITKPEMCTLRLLDLRRGPVCFVSSGIHATGCFSFCYFALALLVKIFHKPDTVRRKLVVAVVVVAVVAAAAAVVAVVVAVVAAAAAVVAVVVVVVAAAAAAVVVVRRNSELSLHLIVG